MNLRKLTAVHVRQELYSRLQDLLFEETSFVGQVSYDGKFIVESENDDELILAEVNKESVLRIVYSKVDWVGRQRKNPSTSFMRLYADHTRMIYDPEGYDEVDKDVVAVAKAKMLSGVKQSCET